MYYSDNSDQIDMISSSDRSAISSPSGSDTSVPNTLESLDEENSMASSIETAADSSSARVVAMETIQRLSHLHSDFLTQWQMMYSNFSDIMYMRIQCADFLTKEWTCVLDCFRQDHLVGVKEYAESLLRKVIDYYDDLLAAADSVQSKMSYTMAKEKLMGQYENDPFEFVKLLATFLLQEEALVKKYSGSTAPGDESMDIDDMSEVMKLHHILEEKKKKLEREIEQLEVEQEEETQLCAKLTTKSDALAEIYAQNPQNGCVGSNHILVAQLSKEVQEEKIGYEYQMLKVCKKKTEIIALLQELSSVFLDEMEKLIEYVKKWKKSKQLCYVELQNEKSLQPIDNWCASLGKVLYDVIQYDFPKLKTLYDDENVTNMEQIMIQLFERLLQQSFLCVAQGKHFIKVEKGTKLRNKDGGSEQDKFRCPKFSATVRLLAAESIDGVKKVEAYFCREDDLVDMHQSNLDPVLKEFPLKGNEAPYEKKTHQAVFKKLELHNCKENFNKNTDKPVCEEKFRMVFKTVVNVADTSIHLMTFSLPLVVITGASQSCNAHGSILWQCYNTEDAFSIETKCPDRLQWSSVAKMLNDKFKTLGGRDLKEQEYKHLAERINIKPKGQKDKPEEDETVHFKQFCVDKMMDIAEGDDKKKSATFWMWFFSVFNLTKTYLRQIWVDGLIEGFINKKTGEELLKSHPNLCSRTFFLRFSDNIITDGQGQSMCGALSASFCYKRGGEFVVDHTSPFKADSLKKKPLANLLKNVVDSEKKENLLVYLFPNMKQREDVFVINNAGRRSKNDVQDGYKKLEELLTVQIENLSLEDESGVPGDDLTGSSHGPLGGGKNGKRNETVTSQRSIKRAKRSSRQQTTSSETKQAKLMEEEAVASPDSTFQNDLIVVTVQTNPDEPADNHTNIPKTVYEEMERPGGAPASRLDRIKSVPCNSGSRYQDKAKISKANSDPSISSTDSIKSKYPTITNLLSEKVQTSASTNMPSVFSVGDTKPIYVDGIAPLTSATTTSAVGYSHGEVSINRSLENELLLENELQQNQLSAPRILGGGMVEGRFIDRNSSGTTEPVPQTVNTTLPPMNQNPVTYIPQEPEVYPSTTLSSVAMTSEMETENIFTTVASILSSDPYNTLTPMSVAQFHNELIQDPAIYDLVEKTGEVEDTSQETSQILLTFMESDNDHPDFDQMLNNDVGS